MLLGIKFSNLSREQKKFEGQKFFLTKFTECWSPGTRQNWGFAECQVEALGKELTPSATLTGGARQARVLGTC